MIEFNLAVNFVIRPFFAHNGRNTQHHLNICKNKLIKPKTFTNPNLLDNQYQLTECFLCCDE